MTIRLWHGRAPQATDEDDAQAPTLEIFSPTRGGAGGCVLVCPGGGYGFLAPHEGATIGAFLASHGIAGAVLKYRVAPHARHPRPLLDASRAMRVLRHRAGEFRIDPRRVAVMGFSAGGHVAATLSTRFDDGDATSADAIERESSRPDAAVLCYPVITMASPFAHAGSRNNLLGSEADARQIAAMSAERNVTARTPPTFVFHTADDAAVPVENALLYVDALRRANVSFEAHLYERGEHGVGLATDDPRLSTWGPLMVGWLRSRGW